MADNLLILLDPHISAEHFPSTEAAPKRATSALPTWRNPSPLNFVPSGDPFLRVLQRPPPAGSFPHRTHVYHAPTCERTVRLGRRCV